MSKEDLIPFKPGQSGNPDGRPPKFLTSLKHVTGLKESQIADCIKQLMSLEPDELQEHAGKSDITVLEKIVCRALLDDIKEWRQNNIVEWLKLILPKPKETVDVNLNIETHYITLANGEKLYY
jgi:hypothetical protein